MIVNRLDNFNTPIASHYFLKLPFWQSNEPRVAAVCYLALSLLLKSPNSKCVQDIKEVLITLFVNPEKITPLT
jgi:hypothetical protein